MINFKSFGRYLAPLAFVAVAACGSDDSTSPTPPGSGLTTQERTALFQLLQNDVVREAMINDNSAASLVLMGLIANNVQSIGTLHVDANGLATLIAPNGVRQSVIPVRTLGGTPTGNYRAFSGQIIVSIQDGTETSKMAWTGVFAVNDLESPTDMIIISALHDDVSNSPTSIPSTPFGEGDDSHVVFASYITIEGETYSLYRATSGQLTITNASFTGAARGCPGIDQVPVVKTCQYKSGSVSGNFNFTGTLEGNPESTVSVPATSFNLPATQLTLSVEPMED
jgi:hypothetical protein